MRAPFFFSFISTSSFCPSIIARPISSRLPHSPRALSLSLRLHGHAQVYDVTNAPSAAANAVVSAFNRLAKDGLGLGGIFHGGVEVHGKEWSFGMCEGAGVTGVYPCTPGLNPMYEYREAVTLGKGGRVIE